MAEVKHVSVDELREIYEEETGEKATYIANDGYADYNISYVEWLEDLHIKGQVYHNR